MFKNIDGVWVNLEEVRCISIEYKENVVNKQNDYYIRILFSGMVYSYLGYTIFKTQEEAQKRLDEIMGEIEK